MIPFLSLLGTALLQPALAGSLPTVDEPLKTGAKAAGDAAVVIGLEDYLLVPDVPYAKRDAQAFYDFLVYTRGVSASRVRLMNAGAGREQILEAVTAAGKQVAAGGTVWVYFAGHGAADASSGERLLLGDDVRQDPAAFSSRGVPVAEVKKLAAAGGGSVALVVDACYGGLGRGGQELVAGKRFLVPAYEAAPKSTVLEWNAAGPDQLSGPLDAVQHGAFTYFTIGALRGWADGHVDGARDGKVTAEEAQLYVRDALRTVQITDQQPQMAVTEPSKWVMSSGSALEAAPQLDAAMAAKPSASGGGKTVTIAPNVPLDVGDRAAVVAWLDGAVGECEARHHGGGDWYVRFSVQPGPKLKGLVVTTAEVTTEPDPATYAMHTCIRERIKNQKLQSPSATIKFKEHFSAASAGGASAATPATGPTTPAPAATPPPETSTTTSVGVGATATTGTTTTGTTETVTITAPGISITTSVSDGSGAATITGPGVGLTTTTTVAGAPTPAASAAQPKPVAAGPVQVTFRALDGEWFDVRVDGKVVAELRNQDEATVTVQPGTHTVEFLAFMADAPFVTGKLDTAGATQAIVFGVDTSAGVTCYNHDGWR